MTANSALECLIVFNLDQDANQGIRCEYVESDWNRGTWGVKSRLAEIETPSSTRLHLAPPVATELPRTPLVST